MKNFSLNQLSTNNRALCIVNHQPNKHCALSTVNCKSAFKSLKSILVIALMLCAHSVWGGGSISWTASHVTSSTSGTGYVAGPSDLSLNGSTWSATGYRTIKEASVIIGQGGANYLQTPLLNEDITSIVVTWSGNTSYYLALQTTDGTELEAKSNPSTATEATFSITSGSYKQLRLVGRRASGTSNAAATITAVTVNYGSSCTAPTSPTNVSTGSRTQDVSWTDDSGSKWDVYCSTTNTAPTTQTTATGLTSKSYQFTNLEPNTTYYWWVRTSCGETSKSSWVAGTSFTTNATSYTDYLTECSSEPSISVNPTSVTGLGYIVGGSSTPGTFTMQGSNLTANVTVTPPTGFEVKVDGGQFSDALVLTPTEGSLNKTIYVRMSSGKTVGDYNGDVTVASVASPKEFKDATVAVSGSVIAKVLNSIEVKTLPTTTTYTLGQAFNPTGLIITAHYNSGDEDVAYNDHSGDFSFTDGATTALTAEMSTIKVYYGGQSADISLTLNCSIQWLVNGESYTTGSPATSVVLGGTVSAPATAPSIECGGKVFVGWKAGDDYEHATDAPAGMFTTTSVAINENTIFRAVFAESNGAGDVQKTMDLNFDDHTDFPFSTSGNDFDVNDVTLHFAYTNGTSSNTTFLIKDLTLQTPRYYTEIRTYPTTGSVTITSSDVDYFTSIEVYATSKDGSTAGTGTISSGSTLKYTHNLTTATSISSGEVNLGESCTSVKMTCTAGQYRIQRFILKGVVEGSATYSNYSTTCVAQRTVSFNMQGHGDPIASVKVNDGGKVSAPSPEPTATGYNFGGWYNESACTSAFDFANTITADKELFAKWTPISYNITYTNTKDATNTNPTSYTIESETINFAALSNVTGYTFSAWSPASIASGSTGDKTIEAQWTTNSHTLTWNLDGGSIQTPGTAAGSIAYGTALTAPIVTKTGYTFKAWDPAVAATMPDNDVTYTATWTANTNTPYLVKHYKQNLAGDGYDLADTDELTGTTGAEVTPTTKDYTGFTVPSTQTVTILADGSLVVTYNYTRNTYTLTWALAGGEITTPGTAAGLVKYGAELTAPTVTKAGSTFTGWTPNVHATMPAADATYTAGWESKVYFTQGETMFIRSLGEGAWGSDACVTAEFSNDWASKNNTNMSWMYNVGSTDYKMFYVIIPNDNYNTVELWRYQPNSCLDDDKKWNSNGYIFSKDRNGKNVILSNGTGTSNVSWYSTNYEMLLKGGVDSWASNLATFADQLNGDFSATVNNVRPEGTSLDFRVVDNNGQWFGDGNTTLSNLKVGSVYNVTASFNIGSRGTLTLNKSLVSATITFDMQGHGEQVSPLVDQPAGQPIAAPATPTATGYEFTGWYTDPSCTQAWNFSDPITESMTLYAGWLSTTFVNYRTSCMIKVKTPTISPAAGSYECAQNITITCATADAAIYYTTDGSNPTTSSSEYTAPFSLESSATVKAIAIKSGMTDSEIASAEYTIITQCPAPTIEPAGQNFDESVEVTISSDFDGTIYYTTNGGDPTTSSDVYSGPFTITETATVKAMVAKGDCLTPSEIVSATYNKNPRYTVTWMVNGASYSAGTPTTEVIENHKVTTLPTAPAHSTLVDDCASEANHFMGWSATNVGETPTTDPGNIFTDAEHSPSITEATTFYAVFAKETSGKGPDIVIDANFNDVNNPYGFPTSSGTTSDTITINGKKVVFNANTGVYFWTNTYVSPNYHAIYMKSQSTSVSSSIVLPAIENYKLTQVKTCGGKNSGTQANLSICPHESSSAITGGSSMTFTNTEMSWTLSSTSVNTSYDIYIIGTNNSLKDIQVSSLYAKYESEGGASTYSGYVTACAACEHRITITKGTPENGTFDLTLKGNQCVDTEWPTGTSTTLTATPDPHYYLSDVTVSGSGTKGEISGNTCTITGIKGDVTITPVFTAIPTHTISWKVNGADAAAGSQTTSLYEGEAFSLMTLPSAPADNTLDCTGATKFMGWSSSNLGWTAGKSAPDDLFKESAQASGTMGTSDVTFYAVFAAPEIGIYKLASDLTNDKDYIFLTKNVAGSAYALDNSPTTGVAVTIVEESSIKQISAKDVTNAMIWKKTAGIYLQNKANSNYLKVNGSAISMASDPSVLYWDNSNGGLYGKSSGGATSYYIQNTNGTFSRSTSPNENNRLYAYEFEASDVITNYVTECCPTVSAPTNLNATPAVDGGTVYWTKSANATAYEIQVNGGAWTNVGDVNSYTISDIACGGTAVNWNIRALNNCYTSTHANSSFYTASCNCDGFQFHYRDFNGIWNTNNVCFSAVAGTEHDQLTDEFALPYANAFNVTWQGSPLSDNKTKTTDFQYMGYFLQNSKNFGVNPQNGNMGGALGKMHIYDNSGSDNMYVQWIPTGYTLQMGDGTNWPTTCNFTGKTSAWNESEWFTDLITVTDAQIGGKIYVGLKTQNGYVWCGTYSESINLNGLRTKTGADSWLDGGLSTSYANKTGKFRIYANSSDKNWYVTFVPHVQLTYVVNGGSGEMDPSAWHSVEETEAERTVTVAANGFTAPSGMSFKGWNTQADGNGDWISVGGEWILQESGSNILYAIWATSYPVRYTGTTTGAIDHYSAEGATEHIKPDPVEQGYTFMGWTVIKDGGGTVEVSGTSNNYTFTMPADGVTIHANMSAGLVTLNYRDMNGGESSYTGTNLSSLPTSHTYGAPTILPAGTKAGYRFDGWHLLSDCSDAAIAELAANVDYANPLAIYAKWTQVQTISFFENGVERTDLAQQAGAGESVTMPASSGIGCGDYQTFLGWVVGTVDETTTAPANIYEAASSFTATGEAVAMHALYTKIVNGDPDKGALGNVYYEKVTSGVTDGVYILVSSHAESPYYYTGQHEASTSTSNYGTVSTTNLTKSGDIVSTPLPASCQLVSVTIGTGANAGKFAMSNGDGYFTATGGNYFNNNISSLANAFVWNLTAGEKINDAECPVGAIHSTDYTTRVLQYNSSRFACYTNTQSNYVNLYRATENGTRYYSTTADRKYTWHSGDDNTEVVRLGCLEEFTPATPVACDGKTFIGWSTGGAVATIQNDPIDVVDFSTYEPTADTEFWAVYATKNGGKLGEQSIHNDNIGELSLAHSWTPEDKICAGGYTTYVLNANVSQQSRSIDSKDYAGFYLNAATADAHFTTYKVNDLKTIAFDYITNGAAINYYVKVSTDNENWTTISNDGATLKSNTDNTHNLSFNTPAIGDYYVQVGVVYKNSGKYAMITNLTYTTTNRTYWYSDYSTNCNKPATTTLTYDVNGGEEIAPVTETGWVELPLPVRENHIFNSWAVQDVAGHAFTYMNGEQYLFNHDVTLTAQWTAQTVWYNEMLGANHDVTTPVGGKVVMPTGDAPLACERAIPVGYTFVGWGEQITNTKTTEPAFVTSETAATSATTYYAIFRRGSENVWRTSCPTVYTITYQANDEAEPATPDKVEYWELKTGTTVSATLLGQDAFSRTGCVLFNWLDMGDETTTYNLGASLSISSDKTLRAQWLGALSMSGDIHMTAAKNNAVYSLPNKVRIQSADLSLAKSLRITYWNGGAQVDKSNSPFRLCNDDASCTLADGGNITLTDIEEYDHNFVIRYTPSAFNEEDNYTLKIEALNAGNTAITEATLPLYGRCLAEQFVIAAKISGSWFALSSQLPTTSGTTLPDATAIVVDEEQMEVIGAGTNILYSATGYHASANKGGVRMVSTAVDGNTRYLTANANNTYLYLPTTNNTKFQDFYLVATDWAKRKYEMKLNPDSTYSDRQMSVYGSKIGWFNTAAKDIYLLPVAVGSGDMMDIVDWNTDQIILNLNGIDPTKGVTASVNGGAATAITEGSHFAFKDTHNDRTYELTTGTLTAGEYVHLNLTYYDSKSNEYNSDRYYRVPYIYASTTATIDKTLTADDDIVVREGKATIESNTVVHNVYVYPGAELEVKSGATLTCANLYVRMKAFAAGEVSGAIEATQTYYTFIIADKQYGLQLALPFESSVETISTTAGDTHTIGKHLKVNYYDAAQRAASGAGNNWKALAGTTLSARTGYEIMSASAYYREYLFPVTYTQVSGEQQMAVSAPTGELAAINNGWNYIASPYTSTFIQSPSGEDDPSEMVKLSELTEDNKTYWQHVMMNIRPAQPFYYQAKEAGKLNFGTILSFKADEPKEIMARKANEPKVQTQWLVLALTNNAGQMDETNLYIHPDKFTEEYEVGYDLEKMLGKATRPQLYSQMECGKLSFNAVSDAIAEDRIPLGYYASQNEKQTFSLEQNTFLTRLEHVYLIDEKEGQIIDLLYSDYEFDAQAGEHTDRFYINCVFKHQTPTVIDEKYLDDPGGPRKFIYNEKLYIESEGVIYDALGKEVIL